MKPAKTNGDLSRQTTGSVRVDGLVTWKWPSISLVSIRLFVCIEQCPSNSTTVSHISMSLSETIARVSSRWNLPLTGDKKTDDDIRAFANARQRILSQTHKCEWDQRWVALCTRSLIGVRILGNQLSRHPCYFNNHFVSVSTNPFCSCSPFSCCTAGSICYEEKPSDDGLLLTRWLKDDEHEISETTRHQHRVNNVWLLQWHVGGSPVCFSSVYFCCWSWNKCETKIAARDCRKMTCWGFNKYWLCSWSICTAKSTCLV